MERVANSQSKGNTPQPSVLPNISAPAVTANKTMNSHELDSVRGSQQVANVPQQPPRDVTRVVKILKQNEPLVIVFPSKHLRLQKSYAYKCYMKHRILSLTK